MAQRHLVVDTSSLINLLATACEVEIATTLDWKLAISGDTRRETIFLSGPPDEDGRRPRVPADLTALIGSGRLTVHERGDEWADAFVRCAEHLPDADAAAVALAHHLGVALATDDSKEARIAALLFTGIEIVSTLDWLREAASVLAWNDKRLSGVVRSLRWRANFLPPRNHPHSGWYADLLSRG